MMIITTERRNQLWEQAQVNGRTDDDLYGRLLDQETERASAAYRRAAIAVLERLNFDTSLELVQQDVEDLAALIAVHV
jgi:hypothetical protein